MKLADLELREDLLYVFVFGPGFGESIVLRVPPDEWIVIDSLRHQTKQEDTNPALELLADHDATVAAIALTHRHHDHAHGLYQLLDCREQGSPVGRTDVFALPDEDWRGSQDAGLVLDTGTVASVLNRIDHIWRTDPSSEWLLVEGARRTVGEATIEVLSPAPNSKPRRGDLNLLSSAMLVTWNECRILAEDFNFNQAPRPPLILPTHPAPGPASCPPGSAPSGQSPLSPGRPCWLAVRTNWIPSRSPWAGWGGDAAL